MMIWPFIPDDDAFHSFSIHRDTFIDWLCRYSLYIRTFYDQNRHYYSILTDDTNSLIGLYIIDPTR